ncbi:MAG TPA: tripartite tricarboxylate transporter TctB family protein [Candidatus Methylomirabilis sp.]|nr:tripartite tricarboxylate transporter TctB family protein [Candidatus Methylomirabilis sp.]HSC70488.1 tripartite tricarboxylate transporter TctB family protein [Candidatus Methylomirabilis sp.]
MSPFRPAQRSGELATSIVLFSIGVVWLVGVLDMPPGGFSVPGPGFFPTLLGLLLCISSAALAGKTLLTSATAGVPLGNRHIWSTGVALVVLAALLEPLGFVPSVALFVGFFLRRLAEFRWTTAILAATAAAAATYWIFSHALGIPLPPVRWF